MSENSLNTNKNVEKLSKYRQHEKFRQYERSKNRQAHRKIVENR